MVSTRTEYEFMSFGGALTWYEEARYSDEMGLSTHAFRLLCKSLQLPMIEIGVKRFVCLPMFKIAMWAVSRIGEPDFLVPGCDTLRRAGKTSRCVTSTLDVEELKKNLEVVVKELVYARKLDGIQEDDDATDYAREAAERLVRAAVHIQPKLFYEEWSNGNAHEVR